MHKTRIALLTAFFLLGACTSTSSDITLGEKLFNDPNLGGGITGKTCFTCHENSEDLEPGFEKKERFMLMGLEIDTLPEVINSCIEIALRGEGIDPEGVEMKALIYYLQKLSISQGKRS